MRRCALQLGGVLAVGCWLLMASAAADPSTGGPGSGALLMPSQPVEQQVDAEKHPRVLRQLTQLRVGLARGVISPEDLHNLLGKNFPESLGGDYGLNELEIEVRAPRGVPERPLEARIPMGLAGLPWGVRHPSQAWRLFLPVVPG